MQRGLTRCRHPLAPQSETRSRRWPPRRKVALGRGTTQMPRSLYRIIILRDSCPAQTKSLRIPERPSQRDSRRRRPEVRRAPRPTSPPSARDSPRVSRLRRPLPSHDAQRRSRHAAPTPPPRDPLRINPNRAIERLLALVPVSLFAPVGRDVPLLSGLAHSNLHVSRALRHQPGAVRRMRIRPGSTTTIAATRSSPARVVSARTSICTNVGAASTLGARARTTP
jgi:hypothetical protein